MQRTPEYPCVKETKEVMNIAEVEELLDTGEWIVIGLVTTRPPRFVLGKIK